MMEGRKGSAAAPVNYFASQHCFVEGNIRHALGKSKKRLVVVHFEIRETWVDF
jgi:hypothetical protein